MDVNIMQISDSLAREITLSKKVSPQYEILLSCSKQLADLNVRIDKTDKPNGCLTRCLLAFAWVYVAGMVGVFITYAVLYPLFYINPDINAALNNKDTAVIFPIITASMITGLILTTVFFIFGSRWRRKKTIEKLKNEKSAIHSKITAANLEIISAYKSADHVVSLRYWDEWTLARLRGYVANGRAETIKEALNLLETELHRERELKKLGEIGANQTQMMSQIEALRDDVNFNTWVTIWS